METCFMRHTQPQSPGPAGRLKSTTGRSRVDSTPSGGGRRRRRPGGALAAAALATLLCWAGTAQAAERAIAKQVEIAATPEQAWQAWTTREGITSFFAPDANIDPRPGGAFEIHFDPLAAPGSKGADGMQYMALQPPRMLSFTWNAPPHLPQARGQRTLVVVRFEPVNDQTTRVTLHHTGWGDGGEWDQAHAYFERAWGAVLGNLKQRFEKGPQDWSSWLEQLRRAHQAAPAASAAR
jgi:uncharacterized protein YndB with AHSA1/START domain